MKISELKKLLKAGEWNDVEFKEGRTAVPKSAFETVSRDGIQFWNPGDVFGDDSRLFEPGEKEVRNPAIAMAMRRIAMCWPKSKGVAIEIEARQRLLDKTEYVATTQSVDFAKIGISDNFCNGGHIGPELVKLAGQKTVSGASEGKLFLNPERGTEITLSPFE